MGHRHLSNTLQMSDIDQDHCRSHGRALPPENGPIVYPMENTLTSGVYSASYPNLECRPVEHPLSSIREGPHFRVPPGSSYDPFMQPPASGSFYLAPENSVGHAHSSYYNSHVHSSYYNRHTIHEMEGGLLDPTIGTERGPVKRKGPGLSIACERGSTSRFYAPGSSSGSSKSQLENPTPGYQNYPSNSIGISPYWGGSLSFGSEDSQRNVRSRPRLDLEPNPRRPHLSNNSSHHYRPMTHLTSNSGTLEITTFNADGNGNTHDLNCITPSTAVHGRFPTSENNVMSHEMNQFLVGGSTAEIGGFRRDLISSRNPVSPPRYSHGVHALTTSEGRGNYSRRAISSYGTGPSFSRLGHEAAPSENGLQFLSETSSSRYSRPSSVGGWHNNHRDGRLRIGIGRFESLSNTVDTHDRVGPEALMMVDRSSLHGSRNLFDQYRDMRLDIENMSYEELLALGERMGNVNTGLSENVISKCLMEKVYSSSNPILEEARCAICLDEYKNKEEVGTVKNCGHGYHVGCIKKWLSIKNACPICKAPAVSDSLKDQ